MAKLVDGMRSILNGLGSQELGLVVSAYNNSQGLYRARNRRPRTDLMLGGPHRNPISTARARDASCAECLWQPGARFEP